MFSIRNAAIVSRNSSIGRVECPTVQIVCFARDRFIASSLLEAAAKARGVTPRKLLQIEVTGKVVPPTDAEAQEFYRTNKQRIVQDYKDAKPGILAQLRSEREVLEAQKFANALRAAADVKILADRITAPANPNERARVLATVNGRPITSGDIEDSLTPLIFQVKVHTYAFRKAELDLKINDLLLDQEAKKQGIPPLALVSKEISGKMPMITPAISAPNAMLMCRRAAVAVRAK